MVNSLVALGGANPQINTLAAYDQSQANELNARSTRMAQQQQALEWLGAAALGTMGGKLDGAPNPERWGQVVDQLAGQGVDKSIIEKMRADPGYAPVLARSSLSVMQQLAVARDEREEARAVQRMNLDFQKYEEEKAARVAAAARPEYGFMNVDGEVIRTDKRGGGIESMGQFGAPEGANTPDSVRALDLRAQRAGLVPGTPEYNEFMVNGGRSSTSLTVGPDGVVQFTQGAGKPLTEGQSKLVAFGNRMKGATTELDKLTQDGFDPANLRDSALREAGAPGNAFMTPQGRQYTAAAREWISGVLRLDSGAAVPETEFWRYFKTYFPQPFDDPDTVKLKEQLRDNVESAFGAASGGLIDAMAPKPTATDTGAPQRIQSDADYDSLPSGATFVAPDGTTRRKP